VTNKILHVGKYYPPYFGGIEVFTQNISEELTKRGFTVEVLSYSMDNRSYNETINGVKIYREAVLFTIFSQPISPRYILRLFKIYKNFDLIHFHSLNPIAEFFSLFLKKNIKKIVTFHHDLPNSGLKEKILSYFYKPILNIFLSRCDKIVSASSYFDEIFPTLYPFSKKHSAIPYGIYDPQETLPKNERSPHEITLSDKEHILFVGRLVKYKNIDTLIRAMSYVEKKLVILGSGPEEMFLKELSKSLNLSNKIIFIPAITSKSMFYSYFKKALLFVFPSYSRGESFGIVLLEAMAFSLPLITSNKIPSICDINTHELTGLHHEAGNELDLAKKINDLISNPKKIIFFGNNSRKKFIDNFTNKKMVATYIELYNSLF
jgi:glycosyltransferase involved in cell wall biosynthesis